MAVPKDKKKFLLWAKEETIELVEKCHKEDGCRTRSEFIERAINFYCGYHLKMRGNSTRDNCGI